MRHLTVRGIPPDLARALEKEARERDQSLNQTVKDLLERALGLSQGGHYDNGLGLLAGSWSDEELQAFEEATRAFEDLDPEQWK